MILEQSKIQYLWFYIFVTFIEKVFRQTPIKNVAGEAWDPAETIRAVRRIKSALISSKSDLYNMLKNCSAANELNI